jgi:hypothetical protein
MTLVRGPWAKAQLRDQFDLYNIDTAAEITKAELKAGPSLCFFRPLLRSRVWASTNLHR